MNALETRLAETERALFFALHELHDGVATQGDYENHASYQAMSEPALSNRTASTQQEKADLVASWASRPLENRTQARAWLESMRRAGNLATDIDHQGQAGVHASNGPNIAPATVLDISSLIETQSGSETIGNGEPNGSIPPERSQQRTSGASTPKGERARGSATRTSEPYRSHEDTGVADTTMSAPRPSRASLFANANKNIYF